MEAMQIFTFWWCGFRSTAKMGHVGHHTMPGIAQLQRSECIPQGLRWADCAWQDIPLPPQQFPLFILVFVRVMLLHQLSCWHCSSSLPSLAPLCPVARLGCCVCSAAAACCVCTCACVCVSEAPRVPLLKSCLWPSLFAWMERDCIALMLWTNSCAEFDTIFFISYCFLFSVWLCCI